MPELQNSIAMLTAMGVLNVGGTAALKSYAGTEKDFYFLIGASAYVLGAACYVALLREQSLAVLALASTLVQLGLLAALSIWLWDDKFNLIQVLGLGTGFLGLSIVLLANPV